MEYLDLVYFGPSYENGQELENEFIKDVKKKFENVKLTNSYDEIKGHRQTVHLPKELHDDYLVWAIAEGWLNCSMTLSLTFMSESSKDEAQALIEKVKIKYPEAIKQ
jgi:hypothetical protein